MTEPTHWAYVEVTQEEREAYPRLWYMKLKDAFFIFNNMGEVKEGPYFWRYVDGPTIVAEGQIYNGPGILYRAVVEVNNAQAATSNPTEESSEVGSDRSGRDDSSGDLDT